MLWYADSSALVKRYVREQGSEWLRKEIVHHDLFISQLTAVEIAAALKRKLREGHISEFVFHQARRRFLAAFAEQYNIVEISQRIIDDGIRLTFKHGLRAYDSVQLATALLAMREVDRNRFRFITSDSTLETVAKTEGLQTDNPLMH